MNNKIINIHIKIKLKLISKRYFVILIQDYSIQASGHVKSTEHYAFLPLIYNLE